MRLIDADTVKAVFEEKSSVAVCGVELCKAIISRIEEAPAVDAVPVRHGHWIQASEDFRNQVFWWNCSECGFSVSSKYSYCPDCGARMDEE